MQHVIFIGNSHLLSVLDAAIDLESEGADRGDLDSMWGSPDMYERELELPGPPPTRARFIVIGGLVPPILEISPTGLLAVHPRYLRALDDATAALDGRVDRVVSCFLGNEHSIFSLMEHPVPFDVMIDAADAGVTPHGSPRQIVPVEVLRRELAERARPTVLSCAVLQARFPDQEVVHLMPPPPIPDEQHIQSRPEVFVSLIEEFGVAPAPLRRKVHRLYEDVLRAGLATCGARLLEPPAAAHDDGYLRSGLWRASTHANRQYGHLVLEQLGAA